MGYVIAAIVVLLLVAGFVTFLVMSSMRKGAAGGRGGPPGIGPDPTPLGDTTEHAGRQTAEGETIGDPERADREAGVDPAQPAPPENRQLGDAGADTRPQSERLANRPR